MPELIEELSRRPGRVNERHIEYERHINERHIYFCRIYYIGIIVEWFQLSDHNLMEFLCY